MRLHAFLRDDRGSGDACERQGDWKGAWRGCDWKERHMLSRWLLNDSHTRANWDKPERSGPWCRLPVFIWSCLSGRMLCVFLFCAVEKLKNHLISRPVERYHPCNCGAHGGFYTPSFSGGGCCDDLMPRPRCLSVNAPLSHPRDEPGSCLSGRNRQH